MDFSSKVFELTDDHKEEIDEFNRQESFNKKDPVTDWERKNTLDC